MSARVEVLRRVREALGPTPSVPDIARAHRVSGGRLEERELVVRFAERVGDYRATVRRCGPSGLPREISAALAGRGSSSVVVPRGLPEAWTAGVEATSDVGGLTTADLDAFDAVVTTCAVGVADTGTIALDGGPGQGRRILTLVPDHHVCVVPADRLVATVPEGLARLEPRRPITLISGPSATSDIELDRVEGVHGPRGLDVIILSGDGDDPGETAPGAGRHER